MYWNNPLIEISWPSDRDPVVESFHNGAHCIFFNPNFKFNKVSTNQKLQDLVTWANNWMTHNGPTDFVAETKNHYDIANLVKLNMWIHDIRRQGIVKPWLVLDHGDGTFLSGTGESRMRCLERIPEITTVPAFISTTSARAHLYSDLEPVLNFDQFADLCGALRKQLFLFRLTDPDAPYGMYWYEYNSDLTRDVTPGQDLAIEMFSNYIQENRDLKFTEEWFDTLVPWEQYKSSN